MNDTYQPTSEDVGKTACVIANTTKDEDGNFTHTTRIEMLTDEEFEKLTDSPETGNFASLIDTSEDCCEAAFMQGYEQGRQEAAREVDYRKAEQREMALDRAVVYLDKGKDASQVVKVAETFLAFLRGDKPDVE